MNCSEWSIPKGIDFGSFTDVLHSDWPKKIYLVVDGIFKREIITSQRRLLEGDTPIPDRNITLSIPKLSPWGSIGHQFARKSSDWEDLAAMNVKAIKDFQAAELWAWQGEHSIPNNVIFNSPNITARGPPRRGTFEEESNFDMRRSLARVSLIGSVVSFSDV